MNKCDKCGRVFRKRDPLKDYYRRLAKIDAKYQKKMSALIRKINNRIKRENEKIYKLAEFIIKKY